VSFSLAGFAVPAQNFYGVASLALASPTLYVAALTGVYTVDVNTGATGTLLGGSGGTARGPAEVTTDLQPLLRVVSLALDEATPPQYL
jgi:enoyl-[acyl-carrier-protein] reductase (NADH)